MRNTTSYRRLPVSKTMMVLFFTVLVCRLSFAQTPQVYIAGGNDGDAVYWLNGKRTALPKAGGYASANAIAVSGSDVYVAGGDGSDAVYWLNGKRTVLPKAGGYASANAIAVSGSNVYIAGSDDSDAVYWLNGKRSVLPKTDPSFVRVAAISVLGSNVYIVGGDGYKAVYWLNGKQMLLGSRQGIASYASAITASGSDVYIVGNYAGSGVYWLNNREISITPALASPSAMVVSGSNIHIVSGPPTFDGEGYNRRQVAYWFNGKITVLPQSNQLAHAYAIALSGSDVYIVGHDGADAVYWQNEKRTVLPKTGKEAFARAIIVVPAPAVSTPASPAAGAAAPAGSAQDLIILRDGNVIDAKVTEITPSEIKYKRANHLDGPTIAIPLAGVLSVRYANGKIDVFNAAAGTAPAAALPAGAANLSGAAGLGGISSLQDVLNRLPAIRVAGKSLKFFFAGETWRAQVNGADVLAGTLTFQGADGGGIIMLKPTEAYLKGRQIPAPSTEIFLDYKAGPPASLRALSKKEQQAVAAAKPGVGIILSSAEWKFNTDPASTVNINVDRETMDGQEKDVLTLQVNIVSGNAKWAGILNENDDIIEKLRMASGVRLKALGDGKPWILYILMAETSLDGGSHRANIKTQKGKVVEIDIPFAQLKQPEWGKRVKFNKNTIVGLMIGRNNTPGAATIKVFDIEIY